MSQEVEKYRKLKTDIRNQARPLKTKLKPNKTDHKGTQRRIKARNNFF